MLPYHRGLAFYIRKSCLYEFFPPGEIHRSDSTPHVPMFVVWPDPFAVGVAVAVAVVVVFGVSTVLIVDVLVSSAATVVVVVVVSSAATIVVVVVAHGADHVLQLHHALVHFIDCRVACG